MRLRLPANLLLFLVLSSAVLYGQSTASFSISSYQETAFQVVSAGVYNITYRVDLLNSGPAVADVKAVATSITPNIVVLPGQNSVDFSPVPNNVYVPSNGTITLQITLPASFNYNTELQWTFTTNNPQPPVANAGPNQTVTVGKTVTLDGTGSTNPSGVGTLSYSWTLTSKPAGSNATLNNPTSAMPTFTVDVFGNYVASLTVSNGFGSSSASVTISTLPVGPVANAGPNQVAKVGSTVTLNGSGSSNPSGAGTLTFNWVFGSKPAGSAATLVNPTSVTPAFVVDLAGTYVINLTVSNGTGSSTASTVVSTNGVPPLANAGPDQSATVDSTVHLNGSGSTDANGNPLTYSWSLTTLPSGSQATLTNANTAFPTFVADRVGLYVAQLIVNNGFSSSTPSTVRINTNDVAPVANAGAAQIVNVGGTVQLNGAGSTDVDGNPLTYAWSFTSLPAGSRAVLSNPTIVNPTFTADVSGTYVAQLIVNDGFLNSSPATVVISTNTVAPTANAGANQNVQQGSLVQLNGSGTDPQGLPLTYQWSLLSTPAGSTATLSNPTIANPTFTADKIGNYIAQLIVNNGTLSSLPSTVTISSTHVPPVANAGANQTNINAGTTVTLDGSGSSSASHLPLTYKWSLLSVPTGSKAALSSATIVNPSFVADQPGMYVAQLIVNDGVVDSAPSTVTISVNQPQPPSANAGSNQTVDHNTLVSLSGSGTDPQNLPLTYQWTLINQPTGSTATLVNATTSSPTFTPDKPGTYVAQLVVNDGFASSGPSVVTITATNTAPVANAGANQSLAIGQTVVLNGSGSTDAEHDPLTYSWTLISVPSGSAATLSGANSISPSFVGDAIGNYVVQLIVNDGYVNSTPSTVTINVHPILPPTANAGPNQTLGHNIQVQLSGSGTDPQNLPLSYQWTLINEPTGSGAVLSNPTIANPTFFADKVGIYVAQLVTSNGTKSSTPAVVTITAGNTPPAANAGTRQNVKTGATVTLNGAGSTDADHDPLTYSWSFVSKPLGSNAALVGANTTAPMFTTDLDGQYIVQLVVNDTYVNSTPALVTVNAATSIAIKLTPNPLSVNTSSPSTMTVTLPFVSDGAGVVVNLSQYDPTVISLPGSVLVPPGFFSTTVNVIGVGAGATSVLATSPGFGVTPGYVLINVTATSLSLSLPSGGPGLGLSRTALGTIVLSAAASTPTTVNLTSSDPTKVTVNPSQVVIPAGAITGTFNVTGVGIGSATITGTASGYGTTILPVIVEPLGVISLPTTLSVGSTPVQLPISLSTPAPAGGVTISVNSSDPTTVALSASQVFIPYQQLTPATPVTVTGLAFGTATISASAPGFSVTNSTTVQVTANLAFSPSIITVYGNSSQNTTLILSSAAPAGGLAVSLSSDKPGVATVPPTAIFAPGKTAVIVPIVGVSAGTATITASSGIPGITSATALATVQFLGAIAVTPSTSVVLGQSTPFNITLPAPAPAGGALVTLTSDNPGVAAVSPTAVMIPFNMTSPATPPVVIGLSIGSANITAASPAFTPATGNVKVTATLNFNPTGLTIIGPGNTQTLSLMLPAPTPVPLTITLVSDAPGIATVPASVTFQPNTPVVTVPVTSVGPGTAHITASANNITGATATIAVVLPLSITTTSLASGTVGVGYGTVVSFMGGTPQYTWSAAGLPPGLTIDAFSGVISGTPTTAGTYTVVVSVMDSSPTHMTATATFSLTINPGS